MSITVFIADDHAVVRDGLRLLLDAQKDIMVVGGAADGRSAVEMIKQLTPNVALVDIAMPELNGIEVTRRVREVSPQTKVIILSMYSTKEHIFRALEAGARGYLLKESAGVEVVKAARAVCAGKRYLCEKISDMMIDEYIVQGKATGEDGPLGRLSDREREVLQLVVEGKSSAEIAKSLNLSSKTVDTYRSRVMLKLGVNDITGLIKFAIQHGLTKAE